MFYHLWLLASFFFLGQELVANETANESKVEKDLNQGKEWEGWYQGTVADGFQAAKASKKPILLYWGARWCPPCNELRENVLTRTEFKEFLPLVTAIYLDGDSDEAQIWGEKLKASGYPTLLFLNSEGRELLRFATYISLEEFRSAFRAAMQSQQTMEELIVATSSTVAGTAVKKAAPTEQQKVNLDTWRMLAYSSDDGSGELSLSALQQRMALVDRFPEELAKERSMFTAGLLTRISSIDYEKDPWKSQQAVLREWAKAKMDLLFINPEAVAGARGTLLYQTKEIFSFLNHAPEDLDYHRLKKQWLAAADLIDKNETYSVDTRLWSRYPWIIFERLEGAKKEALASTKNSGNKKNESKPEDKKKVAEAPLSPKVKELVLSAVERADREAVSSQERTAVISGAASLLMELNEFPRARKLLETEAGKSATPYYYYSGLASLEEKQGNKAEALKWSAKAQDTADGQATKIQWTSSHFMLQSRLEATEIDLNKTLVQYYELAQSLPDGFAGRNASRAKRIADELRKKLPLPKMLATTVAEFEQKCTTVKNPESCKAHFSAIKSEPAKI